MIGYSTIGTNNLEKAAAFYDALFAELGGKRTWDTDRFVAWANSQSGGFAIAVPFDEKAATVGNGTMMGLAAPDRDTVDALYAKAIELGATCDGAPGPRGGEDSAFYAAYFRDLDGNKINFFHMRTA